MLSCSKIAIAATGGLDQSTADAAWPAMPSKRAIGILRARQAKSQPLAPYSFTTEPLGFDLFVSDLKILALAIALRLSLYPPSSHPPAEV